mmetsp:Transcript_23724/g.71266  ORF Transcript_23724/g.71266 Transcript_23724/m.71266 type:complete len:221 (-) Transcript_23724:875-1537(-)
MAATDVHAAQALPSSALERQSHGRLGLVRARGRLRMRHHAANEVRRWNVVLVASPLQTARRHVEAEHRDVVRILVCGDEPLPRNVEGEVPGSGAPCMLRADDRQKPGLGQRHAHAKHSDAVVPAVRGEHVLARAVHGDAAARVELARESVRDRPNGLQEPEHGRGAVQALHFAVNDRLGRLEVKLEHGHLGGKLVHHISHRQSRVELDVPWAKRRAAGGP